MDIDKLIFENEDRGIFRVHRSTMTSEEILALEQERIFDKCWLYLGHESEIEKPGDFVQREVNGRPLILVRGSDGQVRVFHNSCTHWGAKFCRVEHGNAESFQCFYHAWTFSNQGELIGVPDAAGYSKGFDRSELGLKSVRLDTYRGLYFVTFNPNPEPLRDYLAGATEIIDLILDQAETGMRMIAGTQVYTARANWKLLSMNSLDSYHGQPLHATYFDFINRYKHVNPGAPLIGPRPGGARSLGNGHAVDEVTVTGIPRLMNWHPMYGESARPEMERIRARVMARFGEERGRRIADGYRLFLIYPNFAFHDATAISLRYFEPAGVDTVRIRVSTIGPKEESKEQLERRLKNFVSFFGPAGLAHPDDLEAIESAQAGFSSKEVEWLDYSRGLHREPQPLDELQMRVFWRQWRAHMKGLSRAERTDDLGLRDDGYAAVAK